MSNRRFNSTLRNVFREVEHIQEEAVKNCWDTITPNDLECILCSRCIFDPITTACGHTFCKGCLTRVLDHGLSCPLCMAPLSVRDYSRGSSVILDQAIRFLLPQEYNDRLLTNMREAQMLNKNSDVGTRFVTLNFWYNCFRCRFRCLYARTHSPELRVRCTSTNQGTDCWLEDVCYRPRGDLRWRPRRAMGKSLSLMVLFWRSKMPSPWKMVASFSLPPE
jgi:hypothetical protein